MLNCIKEHKSSPDYQTALDAELYASGKNATIAKYQKLLYTLSGKQIPDNFTANHKCKSGFLKRFITQEAAFETGNGVTFNDEKTKERLGKNFDAILYSGVKFALIHKVNFGFYNLDHIEFFKFTEFVPLFDEQDGTMKAGIRFWQLDSKKPLNMTLFEIDGYTDFQRNKDGDIIVLNEKRGYKAIVTSSPADGVQIKAYENYPTFPIVPLWGNLEHQSELVGKREQIDCYDLIKSGFANDLDDASMIYWTLKNTGGMNDVDLAKFVERMHVVKAAVVDGDDGADATAHTMEVPYQSRQVYLDMLRNDLYRDFMALDVESIAAGNVTATQIRAAFEPLNEKLDELEMCLFDFFNGIFAIAGIDDEPQFSRSKIYNASEEIQSAIMAAPYIGEDETTRLVCGILGISDKYEDIIKAKTEEEMSRFKTEEVEKI